MSTLTKAGQLLDLFTVAAPVWGVAKWLCHWVFRGHRSLTSDRTHGDRAFAGTASRPVRIGVARIRARRGAPLVLGLIPAAHPVMEDFVRRLGETVCLGVFLRGCVLFIDKVVGDDPLSVLGPRVGARYEAHGFASQAAARRPAVRGDGTAVACAAPARTDHAPAGRHRRSGTEVGDIRRTGLSFDHGETVQDVGCVAAGYEVPMGGRRLAQHQRPPAPLHPARIPVVVAVRGPPHRSPSACGRWSAPRGGVHRRWRVSRPGDRWRRRRTAVRFGVGATAVGMFGYATYGWVWNANSPVRGTACLVESRTPRTP